MENQEIAAAIERLANVINARLAEKSDGGHGHTLDDIDGVTEALDNMRVVVDKALLAAEDAKISAANSERAVREADSTELAAGLRKLKNRVLFNI